MKRRNRAMSGLAAALILAGCGQSTDDGPAAAASLDVGELLGGADTLHARAVDPRAFVFPADHGPHPEFRTEWWYFTGNLTADDGREFGYQLTFFRSALTDSASFAAAASALPSGSVGSADTDTGADPDADTRPTLPDGRADTGADPGTALRPTLPDGRVDTGADPDAALRPTLPDGRADTGASAGATPGASPWRARHAWMAHFAVSDVAAASFHPAQRFARGAQGLAGAEAEPFRVHVDRWHATSAGETTFPVRLVAAAGDVAIDLLVDDGKPVVLQGEAGLSRKGPEPGNASYYYSYTRMPTSGTVRVGGRTYDVAGYSWLDREWSTSALSPDLAGWDWMALQLDDDTELMLYRLRRPDGSAGAYSAGTFVAADGRSTPLAVDDFRMTPRRSWLSPPGGPAYPVAWRVDVPSLELVLDVAAAFDAQELNLAVRYWEGAVRINGARAGRAVTGRGYLEMTGY